MRYVFTAVLTCQDDGSYEARVPDIQHCVTSGQDLHDAIDMIEDAAAMMLTCLEDDGIVPIPTDPRDVKIPEGSISTLISIDTDKYRIANNTRAVRKNVSLPEWMVTMADKRGLNCSQVLQDALRQILT